MKNLENKTVGGRVLEVKKENRNGVEVGIVEGYIATWDLDRGDGWIQDQFTKGCFKKTIKDHKSRGRQARLKDMHGRTIGGFPASSLKEDSTGLFGRGEINLEVQQGREAYSMAVQGVLEDFSIGFSVGKSTRDEQNNIRTITEAVLWEGSIVDEPMNPAAKITAVKNKEGESMIEISEEDVKGFTKRDLENVLKDRGFTKQAAVTVSSLFNGKEPAETSEEMKVRLLAEIDTEKNAKNDLREAKNLEDALAILEK